MHTGPDTPVRDRAEAIDEPALAVDVGGTTIKAELVDHTGTVAAEQRR